MRRYRAIYPWGADNGVPYLLLPWLTRILRFSKPNCQSPHSQTHGNKRPRAVNIRQFLIWEIHLPRIYRRVGHQRRTKFSTSLESA